MEDKKEMNVLVMRLPGGEEIIGEVIEEKNNVTYLRNPHVIVISQSDDGTSSKLQFWPFMPYAKNKEVIVTGVSVSGVILAEPDDSVLAHYKKMLNPTKIIVPDNKIQTGIR